MPKDQIIFSQTAFIDMFTLAYLLLRIVIYDDKICLIYLHHIKNHSTYEALVFPLVGPSSILPGSSFGIRPLERNR